MKNLISWGMYPKIENRVFDFDQSEELTDIIKENSELIPYGNGRSYGDSAISSNIISVRAKRLFYKF